MTSVLEIQYLPPITYFALLARSEQVLIEAHENYQKGSYRNRALVSGVNTIETLSIPLKSGKNSQKPIQSVQISYENPWISQHWHTIKSAYGRAPYFEYYQEEIYAIYKQKNLDLFDLNWQLMITVGELIGMDTSHIKQTATFKKVYDEPINDYRNCISPKKSRQKDTGFIVKPYPQVFEEKHGFIPNLSILDLLFCTGPEALYYLED